MSRKGQSITLSLQEREKQQLEQLALELGCLWGDRPNISKLIKDIAQNKLRIAPNHDWSTERINALNQARLTLIDQGQLADATAIAALLLERSDINIPLRIELESFLNTPVKPWRLAIEQFIRRQQPFCLAYQDAEERNCHFAIHHAQIIYHESRQYLDCWCQEPVPYPELPELSHNRSLRLERIQEASVVPQLVAWRSSLDSLSVEMRLYNRLAFAYQSKQVQDEINELLPTSPPSRRIVRRVSSLFWFKREVLRYGQDCEVIAPTGVRHSLITELQNTLVRYQLEAAPELPLP